MRLPAYLCLLPARLQWVETCVLTLGVVAFSHWATPHDPYLLEHAFPWIWGVPVLLALRYGMWSGLLSVGCLLGVMFFDATLHLSDAVLAPKGYVIGGVLFIMICGEFGSRWNMHLLQLRERNDYLDQRLQETTRAYHLLGMSHHNLEENLVSQPLTLRDALKRLRSMFLDTADVMPRDAADRLLQLLTQFFQLEIASIYPAIGPDHAAEPLATLGTFSPLRTDDPLVQHATAHRTFSHVMMQDAASMTGTHYLIVAPARASNGMIVGWFVAEQMRFMSLHSDSLYMLKVFLNYFADGVQAARLAAPIVTEHPECPVEFARELPRLVRLQNELGVQSRIVVFDIHNDTIQEELVFHILHHTRGLDVTWDYAHDMRRRLVVLLPFSDDGAVEGYLARIQQLIIERFGQRFEEAGIHIHIQGLHNPEPVAIVRELLASHHDHPTPAVYHGAG